MRRTQMHLTDQQRRRLSVMAKAEEVSEAEIVRRILDQAFGMRPDRAEKLAAIKETAGIMKNAPDWPEWLERVRGAGADKRLRELGL